MFNKTVSTTSRTQRIQKTYLADKACFHYLQSRVHYMKHLAGMIIAATLFIGCIPATLSANQLEIVKTAFIEKQDPTTINFIAAMPDGGSLLLGNKMGKSEARAVKVDKEGNVVWTATNISTTIASHDTQDRIMATYNHAVIAPDETTYACGEESSNNKPNLYDGLLVHLDKNGKVLWKTVLPSSSGYVAINGFMACIKASENIIALTIVSKRKEKPSDKDLVDINDHFYWMVKFDLDGKRISDTYIPIDKKLLGGERNLAIQECPDKSFFLLHYRSISEILHIDPSLNVLARHYLPGQWNIAQSVEPSERLAIYSYQPGKVVSQDQEGRLKNPGTLNIIRLDKKLNETDHYTENTNGYFYSKLGFTLKDDSFLFFGGNANLLKMSADYKAQKELVLSQYDGDARNVTGATKTNDPNVFMFAREYDKHASEYTWRDLERHTGMMQRKNVLEFVKINKQ